MTTQQSLRYEAALASFERGESEHALREMEELATVGHAPAQVFLGWCYEGGHAGAVDRTQACRWFTAAAEQDDPVGQFHLGVFFLRAKEYSAGVPWLQRAASGGYAPAVYRLGRLYESGFGVERNDLECLRYMRHAAGLGHPFAQRWIARRGIRGHDGIWGILRAVLWFARVPMIAARLGRRDVDEAMLDP